MTPTNLFNRYLWLVEQLSPNRRLTKEEIDRLWEKSAFNENGEVEIPRRTFARMRDAVEELFGIRIACDRSANVYYITDDPEEQTRNVRKFLLSAFSVNHLLRENRNLMPRILMDNVSEGGNTFLEDITSAMRDNHRIAIVYQSFEMQTAREFEVCPYALRYANHRWYLLAKADFHKTLRLYALDRMRAVTVTNKTFSLPKDFDASDFFSRFFGAMMTDAEVETIRLKANDFRTPYLRSLPLHHSQKEIRPSEFELRLVPTQDFLQALRSIGPDIEITHPKWLREQFLDEARTLMKRYGRKSTAINEALNVEQTCPVMSQWSPRF